MEQAEAIMAADPSDQQAYQATVNAAVMEIFEACSSQDITGQRISKVVDTLQHIESRVGRFAKAVNARDVAGELTEEEEAKERRNREQLLHGPVFDGEGVSQSMVDELLNGADPGDIAPVEDFDEAPAPTPKVAAPKAEAPKAEAPKAEAPKAAPPKAEAAKPAPKVEPAPKQAAVEPMAQKPAAKPAQAAAPAAESSDGDGDQNSQSDIDALFA
jgi:outer membrane biosynthesis protein TonB